MDTEKARLSANLQRAYTVYKTEGRTPMLQTPRYDDGLPLAPEVPPHAIKSSPIDLVCPTRQTPMFPDIVPPQTGFRPAPIQRLEGRMPTASHRVNTAAPRLTQSEDFTGGAYQGDGIEYEYQLDDAAGIPSLGFFRKPYTMPTNRQGRIGGSWRHIKQCTAQGGSNLLFVDGGIKESDCRAYPPFGIVRSKTMFNQKGQRMVPKIAGTSTSRAQGGFEY